MLAAAQTNIQTILICVAIIVLVGGPCALLALVWSQPPEWRKFPTRRGKLKNDRELIRRYNLRRRHPEVFAGQPPLIQDCTSVSNAGPAPPSSEG